MSRIESRTVQVVDSMEVRRRLRGPLLDWICSIDLDASFLGRDTAICQPEEYALPT